MGKKVPINIIQRLAYAKYLYKLGIEQSKKTYPLCCAAILTLHDSVEHFLQLASEHLDIGKTGKGDITFTEYWDLLSPKLSPEGLTDKEAMKRLNRARVASKHHGINLPKEEIEAFSGTVAEFFEANTARIFGVEFNAIAMAYLVTCAEARGNLKIAYELLEKDKNEDALDKIALAFGQILDEYKGRNKKSPTKVAFPELSISELNFHNYNRGDGDKLVVFAREVKASIEAIQESLKIISLGIDFRRYMKFHLLTPIVNRTVGSQYYIHRKAQEISKKDIIFCHDFVIESAIILQAFDFNT